MICLIISIHIVLFRLRDYTTKEAKFPTSQNHRGRGGKLFSLTVTTTIWTLNKLVIFGSESRVFLDHSVIETSDHRV